MQNLLFVEPDKSLGQTYKKYFTDQDYKVEWVQSSDQALESLDKSLPDLIVIELQIPAHNGLELIYEIRSYSDWRNLKILINSTVAESKLAKSPVYKQLGIVKYIGKSDSTLEDLSVAIKTVLTA